MSDMMRAIVWAVITVFLVCCGPVGWLVLLLAWRHNDRI